jgi:hypothetical protein
MWPGVVRGPLKITVALQSADNPALSVQAIDINPIPDNRSVFYLKIRKLCGEEIDMAGVHRHVET